MKKESVLENIFQYLEKNNIHADYYHDSEDGEMITANWNDLEQGKYDQLENILERFDVEIDWNDEWDSCSECGYGIRIQPTHYGWQPKYILDEYGGRICHDCFEKNPKEYIELYKENTNVAFPSWAITTLEKFGYHLVDEDYETGFHYGQNDDPEVVLQDLMEKKIYDFVFVIRNTGQFDVTWSVMIKGEK